MDPSTVAVSKGRPENVDDPLNFPITLASNFHGAHYSRVHGELGWSALEEAVAALEAVGAHALSFSSGMAACNAIIYSLRPKVVILPTVCYLGVRFLLDTLSHIKLIKVDITDTKGILEQLENADLLWLESPTNPMLQVAELDVLIPAAAKKGVRTVVDATFATPMSKVKPLELGASIVMHSATKMIGGHSDLLMGLAVTKDREILGELIKARTEQGATPGSLEAFLCLRGLRTLPLRYERSSKNAELLVERLRNHQAISKVVYPNSGNMISFIVNGGAKAADACVAQAKLIVKATSLGSVETSFERRQKYGGESHIDPGLIRMSVGVENVEDIWNDLKKALDVSHVIANRVVISKSNVTSSLLSVAPAAEVESGSVVSFETADETYEAMSKGAALVRKGDTDKDGIDLESVNKVTGPLAVKNAEPGDSIKVTILDITISRCWSVWESEEKLGSCLAAKRAAFSSTASVRELQINPIDQSIAVSERLHVPLEPMIGCIATATKDTAKCSTFEPTYAHGGNMDLKELCKGTEIILPVLVDGALLFVGDLHAAMGRGEATWVGFEASGMATLKVDLIKGVQFPFPRIRMDHTTIFTAVHDACHDKAMQSALSQAYDFLVKEKKLTEEEAFGFLTAQSEARFGGPASKQALVCVPDVQPFLAAKNTYK